MSYPKSMQDWAGVVGAVFVTVCIILLTLSAFADRRDR